MVSKRRSEEDGRARGLAILLDVSRNLVGTLDLSRILQAAVDGVTKLVGLDTAAVYLLDDGQLRLWATTPPIPADFPEEMRYAPLADHPRIERAVESRTPVLVPDVRLAEMSPAERAVTTERDVRTLLAVPLVTDVTVVGAFLVGSTGEPRPLSDAQVDLSSALANLVALAVKNAQLYRDGVAYAAQIERTLVERERAEAEQRDLQEQLLQARKLESLGRLAGGVAHDFNNMLSVIMGHSELAMLSADPADAVTSDLARIRDAAERSARLTQQLLAFARKQPASPRVLDLNETIEGLLAMLRRLIREEIELSWSPGDSLWPTRIDPAQVDQILVNLCVNARDSISGVGRVSIETENVPVDETFADGRPGAAAGDYVMLSVSDSGRGMDAQIRNRIFEPFFTTKDAGRGTGLGLATVYGIVRQNGGFIRVDSEPDEGATFRIYLPRSTGDRDPVATDSVVAAARGSAEAILFVEDEPALLTLGTRMLEIQGYQVFAAGRPSQALRLAEQHRDSLRLLVTDIVMPEMNGPELARRLRALCPEIGTLFISGYAPDVPLELGKAGQEVVFVRKPFTMKDLAAKVREALARR